MYTRERYITQAVRDFTLAETLRKAAKAAPATMRDTITKNAKTAMAIFADELSRGMGRHNAQR